MYWMYVIICEFKRRRKNCLLKIGDVLIEFVNVVLLWNKSCFLLFLYVFLMIELDD